MTEHRRLFARPGGLAILSILLLLAVLLAARTGSAAMSAAEFFGGLLQRRGYETQSRILYAVRLPRVLSAVVAGAGLSASGVLLQSVTGNDLAGPNIIGVNSGAGLAVMLLLFFAPRAALATPFAAFAGAFLTTLLIVSVSTRVGGSKASVILVGIAVSAILNAGISFLSLLDTDVLASYNYFSVGGLSGVLPQQLPVPAAIILVSIGCAWLLAGKIDILCLGDSVAVSLGVRVTALRTVCLMLASACAAAVVSFAGLLGFVGLMVPHIARRLCGSATGRLLPVAVLTGSILVVLSDLLGRILFRPSELPVGVLLALLGAPFFFWLLMRRNRHDAL